MDILIEEVEGSLWAAALEKNELAGLEIDMPHMQVHWGAIYAAKVLSIDATLNAAYLDLGDTANGIIRATDIRTKDKKGIYQKTDKPIGKVLNPGDMTLTQTKSAYNEENTPNFESKLPQLSMEISLQGRYLIYCPFMEGNRISARLHKNKSRKNIESMLDAVEGLEGCIMRAATAEVQNDVLFKEAQILKDQWEVLDKTVQKAKKPGLIKPGPNAIERLLSDHAAYKIDSIEVVTMDHFNAAEKWCAQFAPDLMTKIQPVEIEGAGADLALFDYHDVTTQIEDLLHPYVVLPNGGNIIIQQTAALTAIDVNPGSARGSNLAVNLEAAEMILKQMKLRNLGGIIMIDFLKTKNSSEDQKLKKALKTAGAKDPCTVQVHGKTKLGLYELTRKRRTPPLMDVLNEALLH